MQIAIDIIYKYKEANTQNQPKKNETQRRFCYSIVTDPLWDIDLFETTYTIISMHLLPKIHIAIRASQLTRILIAWIVKEVCGTYDLTLYFKLEPKVQ